MSGSVPRAFLFAFDSDEGPDGMWKPVPWRILGLTDAQLRASPVPMISAGINARLDGVIALLESPLVVTAPGGASANKQDIGNASLASLVTLLGGAVMSTQSGLLVAPALGVVVCDTGPLAAGDYDVTTAMAVSDTIAAGKACVLQHRDAANTGNVRSLAAVSPNGGTPLFDMKRYHIDAGERLRVVTGTIAGAAGSLYVATIRWRLS